MYATFCPYSHLFPIIPTPPNSLLAPLPIALVDSPSLLVPVILPTFQSIPSLPVFPSTSP